ncbi:MAG: nitrilase-related carbon-nitrogen hydrolase [Hasllibacter sp.]
MIRAAACAWQVRRAASWAQWEGRLDAALAGLAADLAVFPEYGLAELSGVAGAPADPAGACEALAAIEDEAVARCADLARRHRTHLLSPGGPGISGGRLVNRCALIGPDGAVLARPAKAVPTRWERANTPLSGGAAPSAVRTALGTLGVLICHDAEFPDLAAPLRGCDLVLVPACTDTVHGMNRVRIAARARALEVSAVAVLSMTAGALPGDPLIDANHGVAGLYAPPDGGAPPDGVLAEGPGWRAAPVDGTALRAGAAVDVAADAPLAAAALGRA